MALALLLSSPALASTVLDSEPNDTLATAQSLDGNFSLDADADIESSTTIPHATVANSTEGGFDWFSFTVASNGSLGIFDLDYGQGWDPFLDLFDATGTRLLWSDDDPANSGAGGSTSVLDPYLQYTFALAGTYFIRVGSCCFQTGDGVLPYDPFDDAPGYAGIDYTNGYELQVSLTAPGGVPEPSTWAMMLIGFGAIGFSMRRSKQQLQPQLA